MAIDVDVAVAVHRLLQLSRATRAAVWFDARSFSFDERRSDPHPRSRARHRTSVPREPASDPRPSRTRPPPLPAHTPDEKCGLQPPNGVGRRQLKDLASTLQKYMEALSLDPARPDNQLQELAKLTAYPFPNYAKGDDVDPATSAFMAVIQSPILREVFIKQSSEQSADPSELMAALAKDPKAATVLLGALSRAGHIGLPATPKTSAPHPSTRGSRQKKGRRR